MDTAFQLMSQTLELACDTGSLFMESRARTELGQYLLLLNRPEEAEEMCLRAHQLFTEMSDHQALPVSFIDLAEISLRQGNTHQARERAEQGLTVARESGSMRGIAVASHFLARIAVSEGYWETARARLQEAIFWYDRCHFGEDAVRCLEVYAEIELSAGSPARAAWCLGAVDGVLQSRGIVRSGILQNEYVELTERVKEVLDEYEWLTNFDAAKQLSVEQILSEIRSWHMHTFPPESNRATNVQ